MLLNTRRSLKTDEELDMTPMVDVVFQLMTFLLLTYQASTEPAVQMPEARHGVGVEDRESIVLTVAPPKEGGTQASVYLGLDLEPDKRLADNEAIKLAVESGLTSGKRQVVIQADGDVSYGEVMRVAGAAGEVQGISLHVGVEEPE
jgi:biopolymer transport protein ExbD